MSRGETDAGVGHTKVVRCHHNPILILEREHARTGYDRLSTIWSDVKSTRMMR